MKAIIFDLDGVLVDSGTANNAGTSCYFVLKNPPLIRSYFDGLVSQAKIFEGTGSVRNVLCK